MGFASLVAVGAAVALVGTLLGVLLLVVLRSRAATRRDLDDARAETAALHRRLEQLAARLEQQVDEQQPVQPTGNGEDAAVVITDAGSRAREQVTVPDRVVLSTTVGEPLVRAAALGHGLRRALAPQTRNRIWFEMRREVRARRRRRRREVRAHAREARAAERAEADRTDAA